MINGDVNEFVEGLYYGDEMAFLYDGKKYFIQGWRKNGIYMLFLDRWEPPADDYIWKMDSEKEFPVEEFLQAKIFHGKSFWEVEQEIEWVDW